MELSRQMLLLTAVNYGSYYLHITRRQSAPIKGHSVRTPARAGDVRF